MTPRKAYDYSARHAYDVADVPSSYETERFSGLLGRYRWRREQEAVKALVARLPQGIDVLDCPCGTGRWWQSLAARARSIVALDVSSAMLEFALQRAGDASIPIDVRHGDAEALPLHDNSVDVVFSFALTKHLPVPVQYDVLREFARVARHGVVCSFSVLTHLTYEIWRRRRLQESYPVTVEELGWMAEAAGLRIVERRRCTTPVGVENVVLFACAG